MEFNFYGCHLHLGKISWEPENRANKEDQGGEIGTIICCMDVTQ